jgi:GDP-4-dehydro-6-deoxy-D-mannose reductase
MITALITGVSGFCGRHLANRLHDKPGISVVGADIHEAAPQNLPHLSEYFSADLSVSKKADELISRVRPDWVFHLAGLSQGSPEDLYRVNLLAGIELLHACRSHAADARILMVGSAAEYGRVPDHTMPVKEEFVCSPRGDYALSKYALTLASLDYAHHRGIKVVVARPFNILGSGIPPSLVVGAILQRAKIALEQTDKPVIRVGNLDTKRDFVDVEDVVEAYITMLQQDHWGEIFNICSGVPHSIQSVAEELLSFAPSPVRLQIDSELLRPSDVPVMYGAWEKAHKAFGFVPRKSLHESLREAWESTSGARA